MLKKIETAVSEEAFAYTPGLKVKHAMIVSKTRRLPLPGSVFVRVGDKVSYDTIVARTQIHGDPEILKAAALLDVEPEDLPGCLTKKVGDEVRKGEVIAAQDTLFGLIKKRVVSPVNGTLEVVSGATGQIILRGPPKPVEVDAYIPGRVTEVLPKEGAVIETDAAFIQGIFGIGGEAHGRIKMVVNSPDEELDRNHIHGDCKGVVAVGGSLVTLEALMKGVEAGVSCIVAGGVRHRDITTFMGEEVGVAITGQEQVGLTLIITEGFGEMRMSQRAFSLFRHFEGCIASVNGATQIRAGVLRPEIVIPHEERPDQVSSPELSAGMVIGTLVRVIREPYFGAIGKVVNLPVELNEVESESRVRILQVELDDGRVVTVPRANAEIIEE